MCYNGKVSNYVPRHGGHVPAVAGERRDTMRRMLLAARITAAIVVVAFAAAAVTVIALTTSVGEW